ncbi:hypothetical protein [Tropicimonas marinistellae]|uniref:hypothetical protein n=1 Tax=Tropicimonas marinistellae TaxID=1739787 RepID=UPI00083281E2|nr:hypothetical protein [Tropicimonas marinistellae]
MSVIHDDAAAPIRHASVLYPHRASSAVGGWLRARFQRIRRRRKFLRLLDFDDKMLDDIGVSRREVEAAAGLPLSQNAALELQMMAQLRKRREQAGQPR